VDRAALVQALAPVLRDAVDDDRQDYDRDPGVERGANVGALEGPDDRHAETGRADEDRDHAHPEGEPDRLVYAAGGAPASEGQLDLEEGLRAGGAERSGGLDRRRGHATD